MEWERKSKKMEKILLTYKIQIAEGIMQLK